MSPLNFNRFVKNRRLKIIIRGLAAVLLANLYCSSCFSQAQLRDTNYIYEAPQQLNDGINTGNLTDGGLDSDKIIKLTGLILADTFTNVHSLLIMRNNKLIYENYFTGGDEIWGLKLGYTAHDKNAIHDIRSISKSIVSACIGIAIMQNKIKSVDDPIFNYLPGYLKYKTTTNDKITIRDLLTMSSGIAWDEDTPHNTSKNDESQMEKSDDAVAYTLSLPVAEKPGSVWNYNSGGVQVLAEIIKNVSGYSIDQFADKFLFGPMGINGARWIKMHNTPAAASGLRLKSRDLLKIGLLYLNKGKYNDIQLLPKDWAKESLSTQILRDSLSNKGYGYLWWTQTNTASGKKHYIVSARGNGGQDIFIDQQSKLIVVITAGNYNRQHIINDGQMALVKYILPALR